MGVMLLPPLREKHPWLLLGEAQKIIRELSEACPERSRRAQNDNAVVAVALLRQTLTKCNALDDLACRRGSAEIIVPVFPYDSA
jgi:hypothetical protein